MKRARSTLGQHPWKHMFLIFLVCLLLLNLFIVLSENEVRSGRYGVLIGAVALIFNHIAFQYMKIGWPSNVMKTIAWAWLAFMLVYIFGT